MTVRESILANIKTVLQTVTIGNGYDNTLASVQRWRQSGNNLINVPCVIINAGPEDKQDEPNPYKTCLLTVYLDLWNRQDADSTADTDTILNSIYGDIEKALMVDITRGGYAIDTNVRSAAPFETVEGQPHAGLTIEIEIQYQHLISDPETAA